MDFPRLPASPVEFLILLGLILVNGMFAMSEIAIVSSRRARLQQRTEAGSGGARMALKLSQDPGNFLSTVQVGITTIGILSGAFGENAIAERLITVFDQYPLIAPYSKALATVVMVAIITYLSVVLGELVPKRFALQYPETIASLIAAPMHGLSRLTYPVVRLFSLSSTALLSLLGARDSNEPPVTEEEIKSMLKEGTEAGVFERAEQTMVGNVFRLDDLRVTAIMTPRPDIAYLDLDDPPQVNRDKLAGAHYLTWPVCRDGLDQVIGVLYAKDVLRHALAGAELDIEGTAHPAVFVPESISPMQLIETFRRRRTTVALIVDEYGGLEGMVTLSDLLEAIVGDLPWASSGDEEDEAVRREDGSWLLDAGLQIERLQTIFPGTPPPDPRSGYHTLGGLVLDRLGRIPSVGDHFDWGGLRFEVVDMDRRRIDRLLVSSLAPAPMPD